MAATHILVVDDEPLIRDTLSEYLLQEGFQVTACASGEEALERAAGRRFDVALCDVQLPGIDGIEALARLRADEHTASIPVLALTAQAMSGDRERFLEAGFDGYLSKPVDVAELIRVVGEHCDRG